MHAQHRTVLSCFALLVGVFAPYGTFSWAGGTVRLDHLVIPLACAAAVLSLRRFHLPPLAAALLAFALLSSLATVFQGTAFFANVLGALKNLDGLLRGAFVFITATAVGTDDADRKLVNRTLLVAAVGLGVMGALERVLPLGTPVIEELITLYGGPVQQSGIYLELGVNHKHLMIGNGRASAVFPTAPALAMASVLLLVVSSANHRMSTSYRLLITMSSVVAGIASSSKSFLLGIPAALVGLMVANGFRIGKLLPVVAVAGVAIGVFSLLINPEEQNAGVLEGAVAGGSVDVFVVTGGRFGGSGWTAIDPLITVLEESPIVGFGLVTRESIVYSDSGINRLMLHGGLLGLGIVVFGIVRQFQYFRRRRRNSEWATIGLLALGMGVLFFLAGAVFVMPRVNDILFFILGVAVSNCKAHEKSDDSINARQALTRSSERRL